MGQIDRFRIPGFKCKEILSCLLRKLRCQLCLLQHFIYAVCFFAHKRAGLLRLLDVSKDIQLIISVW